MPPALPPGFTLDAQPRGAAPPPPLPPGFALDQQATDLQTALNARAQQAQAGMQGQAGPKGDALGPTAPNGSNYADAGGVSAPPANMGPLAALAGGQGVAQGARTDATPAWESALGGAVDAMTFGFADEMGAGLKTGGGLWGDYGKQLGEERARMQAAQEANPAAFIGGQVAGAVPTMFIPGVGAVGNVARGATTLAKIRGAATAGALTGAAYGAGSADGNLADRAVGAAQGATVGGVVGGAIPIAGKAIGAVAGKIGANATVPALAELKTASQALYAQAKAAGVVIKPQAFDNLANRVEGAVKSQGFNATITPKAAAALDEIVSKKGTSWTPTLEEIDQLRQIAGQVAKSTDANERRVAGIIQDQLDNWAGNLSPRDAIAGDPKAGFGLISQARDLWRVQAKAQKIEDLIFDATGNIRPDNEIRNGFNALRKNKNALRGFTDEEKRAVYIVAHGGAGGRTKKLLGTLDPRNPVMAVMLTALGVSHVGVPLAVAGGAAGLLAKKSLSAGTTRAANAASATVRNSGQKPYAPLKALASQNATNTALAPAVRGGAVPSLLDLLPR